MSGGDGSILRSAAPSSLRNTEQQRYSTSFAQGHSRCFALEIIGLGLKLQG